MENERIIRELSTIDIPEILATCHGKSAAIFDMDGTILDSEPIHFLATSQILGENLEYTQGQLYGLSDLDVFELLKDSYEHDFETFLTNKNAKVITLLETTTACLIKKEIYELLDTLQAHNIITCLVTASERSVTDSLLRNLKLEKYFKFSITRQDVEHTKPHPGPYQLALKMLEVDKEKAIIFEDSPTGIESARQAGIDTIKVTWYE